jgi:hypothetical protein
VGFQVSIVLSVSHGFSASCVTAVNGRVTSTDIPPCQLRTSVRGICFGEVARSNPEVIPGRWPRTSPNRVPRTSVRILVAWERLKDHEIEGLMRSAAMAPPSAEAARRVLDAYQTIEAGQKQLEELLRRLGPAWAEVRAVLNELAAMFGESRA